MKRIGRNDEAEQYLSRAVLIRPELIGALYNLADHHLRARRLQGSRRTTSTATCGSRRRGLEGLVLRREDRARQRGLGGRAKLPAAAAPALPRRAADPSSSTGKRLGPPWKPIADNAERAATPPRSVAMLADGARAPGPVPRRRGAAPAHERVRRWRRWRAAITSGFRRARSCAASCATTPRCSAWRPIRCWRCSPATPRPSAGPGHRGAHAEHPLPIPWASACPARTRRPRMLAAVVVMPWPSRRCTGGCTSARAPPGAAPVPAGEPAREAQPPLVIAALRADRAAAAGRGARAGRSRQRLRGKRDSAIAAAGAIATPATATSGIGRRGPRDDPGERRRRPRRSRRLPARKAIRLHFKGDSWVEIRDGRRQGSFVAAPQCRAAASARSRAGRRSP